MTHSGDGHSETTSAILANERSTPPPPPPPPPPPLPPKARPKAAIPLAPLLPSTSGLAIRNSDFLRVTSAASSTEPQQSASPERLFQPCHMFFYGSLMDPEVLQSILELPELPIIRHGSVTGFSVKMWGIYPALVRNGSGTVSGTVWKATSEAQFLRLAAYETSVYTWCECDIRLSDSEVLHHCRTFCWAGDPYSQELEEGSFDLERYQRYFKSSITRGRTT